MSIRNLLEVEITDEFEQLNKMQLGTDEYKVTVDALMKLCDRAIEIDKLDNDVYQKEEDRVNEFDFKTKQMDSENKDNRWKNGITIASVIIPVGVTIWGTLHTFKFEETGTITTIMGRGFINKLLPKK